MYGGTSFLVVANANMHDRGIWGEGMNLLGGWAWEMKKMKAL
jgi:hypothetical protein